MSPEFMIIAAFVVFLLLLGAGMSIPFAITLPGIFYLLLQGGLPAMKGLGLVSWGSLDSFTLTAIPLFIFMAEIMQGSGLTLRIYRGLATLVAPIPGGLLQTNIASVFHVGQAVARHMIARGSGKIINIGSVQTALARPGIAPYTATKGAVGNLTKGMATDWARHGLQCNAIAPGYFDTALNAALVADPEFSLWLAKRTPAGRWGRVEELVGAAVFLASDASSFVNGHILYVDGGITASL